MEEVPKPKWQTDIEKLLTSGRLPKDAPLESVPAQLQSHPKRFQLQVLYVLTCQHAPPPSCACRPLHTLIMDRRLSGISKFAP